MKLRSKRNSYQFMTSSAECVITERNHFFLVTIMIFFKGKYRNLWEAYYKDVDGVAFVVDSSDRLRVAVARDELWLLLDHKEFAPRKVTVVQCSNTPGAFDPLAPFQLCSREELRNLPAFFRKVQNCFSMTRLISLFKRISVLLAYVFLKYGFKVEE